MRTLLVLLGVSVSLSAYAGQTEGACGCCSCEIACACTATGGLVIDTCQCQITDLDLDIDCRQPTPYRIMVSPLSTLRAILSNFVWRQTTPATYVLLSPTRPWQRLPDELLL